MSDIKARAAAIRRYLNGPDRDPGSVHTYADTAARWEAARLLCATCAPTPADERRLASLADLLAALTDELGLLTCDESNRGAEGIAGLTDPNGWLPLDPSRILCSDWREAARMWQ